MLQMCYIKVNCFIGFRIFIDMTLHAAQMQVTHKMHVTSLLVVLFVYKYNSFILRTNDYSSVTHVCYLSSYSVNSNVFGGR